MGVPYDVFTEMFLAKISEYDFDLMSDEIKTGVVDGYMKRALSQFYHVCKHDFFGTADDESREFALDIQARELVEIADIISEGMVVQWLSPFLNHQDLLEDKMNTRDFTVYSPANLLLRVREAHGSASRRFTNMIKGYSYHHGDLTDLHL